MKLLLQKEIFLDKITLASRFTSNRLSSISILQGVLVENKKNIVHIHSTNLNSFFHTSFPIKEGNDFRIIIEPKKIIEFLSFFSSGNFMLGVEDKRIVISQEKIKGTFPLLSGEEFPLPPTSSLNKKNNGEKNIHNVKSSFFAKNLPLVLFASSGDQARPVLSGINFVSQEEDMGMVATDGFRLSLLKIKREVNIPSIIIPSVFLNELLRYLKEENVYFEYIQEEKSVLFKIGNNEFYSRLIEGEYPPFEKVIPIEKKTTVIVQREDFLRNIKLISIFARDLSHIVLLEVHKDGILIKPKSEKEENDTTFQEAQVQGEEQRVAFNYKFIIDFLTHITTKNIIIEIMRSDAPVVFKGEGQDNFLHIIMPVRIN